MQLFSEFTASFLHMQNIEEKAKVNISSNLMMKKNFASEQILNSALKSVAFCVSLSGILQNPENQTVGWERAFGGCIVKSDSLI